MFKNLTLNNNKKEIHITENGKSLPGSIVQSITVQVFRVEASKMQVPRVQLYKPLESKAWYPLDGVKLNTPTLSLNTCVLSGYMWC